MSVEIWVLLLELSICMMCFFALFVLCEFALFTPVCVCVCVCVLSSQWRGLGTHTRRLAREMVRAVVSASCWHLSLSAVAFSNLAVSFAKFSLRCCQSERERAEGGGDREMPLPPRGEARSNAGTH